MALRHLNPHIHQHIRQKLAARRARLVRRGTPPHQRAVHRYVLLLPRLVDRRANRLIHPDGRGVALLRDYRVHLARHQSRLKRAIHQQQQRFHQIVEPRQPRWNTQTPQQAGDIPPASAYPASAQVAAAVDFRAGEGQAERWWTSGRAESPAVGESPVNQKPRCSTSARRSRARLPHCGSSRFGRVWYQKQGISHHPQEKPP